MRRIKEVETEKCVVPEVRITAVYDEELTALLKDSLDAMGQIIPIVVVEFEGTYYVADGKHRLEEAKARGDKKIKAIVSDGRPEDVLLLNLVTNRTRGKTKASELVTVVQSLYQDYQVDIDQIAHRTGMSRDTIEKYITVSKAAPEVREALDAEVIGISHAFEISRLPHFEQQAEVLAKYQIWRWSAKDLHEQINQVLSFMENSPAPPTTGRGGNAPPQPICDVCKEVKEIRDLRAILACPGCFGLAWNAIRERQKAENLTATAAK